MLKIPRLLTQVRIGELADTATALINTCTTSGISEDATLVLIVEELKASNQALVVAVEKDQALSRLDEHDGTRDQIVQDLFYYTKGCSRVGEAASIQAAQSVFEVIQKYGVGIVRLSYAEESTQINSLLGDLATPALASQVERVAFLPALVAKLKTAQTQF